MIIRRRSYGNRERQEERTISGEKLTRNDGHKMSTELSVCSTERLCHGRSGRIGNLMKDNQNKTQYTQDAKETRVGGAIGMAHGVEK